MSSSSGAIQDEGVQKSKEHRLQKLEDVYFLFEKWAINLITQYGLYLRCYQGLMSYRDTLDVTKNSVTLEPGDHQKILMLLHIYFQDLLEDYQLVENARDSLGVFFQDPAKSRLSADDLAKALNEFANVSRDFKEKISGYAVKLY